jgi:hypothetical protein
VHSLKDTKPKVATCNRCGQIVIACMSSGLRAAVDPTPLNFEEMREALVDGHQVYRMYMSGNRPTRLEYVSVAMLRLPAAPYGTYAAAHGCGCHAMDSTAFEDPVDPSRAPVAVPAAPQGPSLVEAVTRPRSETSPAVRCSECKGLIPAGEDRISLEWPVWTERQVKIRRGATIELTDEHFRRAYDEGRWRWNRARREGMTHTYGMRDGGGHEDIVGACGELAYALYLGVEWNPIRQGTTEEMRRGGDGVGWNIDVKTTNYPGGRLWVGKDALPDVTYVLVNPARTREFRSFRVYGLITGYEFMKPEFWGSFGQGRPNCYIAPHDILRECPKPGPATVFLKEEGTERWVIHSDGCPTTNSNGRTT